MPLRSTTKRNIKPVNQETLKVGEQEVDAKIEEVFVICKGDSTSSTTTSSTTQLSPKRSF